MEYGKLPPAPTGSHRLPSAPAGSHWLLGSKCFHLTYAYVRYRTTCTPYVRELYRFGL